MADMNFGVHVLPKTTTTYNLGSTDKKWNNIYGTLKGNADTATKLGTSTIGSTNRGIYLNSGTPTALTWYPNYCTITSGNQGNYPWHRFATMTTGTSINIDRTVIVILHGRYNGGPYGIIKLSTRVNSSGSNINIKAVWLLRDGFSPDDVKIAKTGNSSGTNTTIDAYIHRGAWSRTIGYIMEGSNLGWSLINSNEVYDTTTSDKLDSVEVYTDINRVNYNEIVTAVDGGRVNWANGTDYATNVRVTETNPTSATKYYPNFTTGITANTNYVLRGTPHYYLYDAGTAATGVYLNIGAANYKGGLTLHTNSSYYGDIAPTTLTANRTYTLPDASGTVALTSNLSAYVLKAGDTMTGTLKLVSGSGVYTEGNSMFYWLSGSTSSYQKQAAIFTTTSTVNSKKVCERFYFREYSHNSSTGAAIEEWDQYRLPVVAADKTSADTYEILTSKSAVTIAQGGTSATTAGAAANNLLLGLPTWTANPNDDTYFIRRDTAGGDAFGQVKASTIYNYIKGKTDSLYVKKAGDTMTGTLVVPQLTINSTTAVKHLEFSRNGYNYITMPNHDDATIAIGIGTSGADSRLVISKTAVTPGSNNGTIDLGSSSYKWRYIYGALKGNADTATKANGLVDGTSTMTSAYNKAGLAYGDYTWLAGWNGYELRAVNKSQFAQASHSHAYLPLAGGTMNDEKAITFQITRKKDGGGGWAYNPIRMIGNDNAAFAAIGAYGSANTMTYMYIGANAYNGNNLYIYPDGHTWATKVYGAVWNDYAEYRKDNPKENQEPGRCIKELGDGSLALTTKRLERGCEIVSDTFGFAIGQDEKNGYNTPIASNGRVLAYPYESIEEFTSHIGWPVCSGPNGTVSIMTEEEEEKYPSRIIGTISEIPTYDTWGTGNVNVNGRVWIRIR